MNEEVGALIKQYAIHSLMSDELCALLEHRHYKQGEYIMHAQKELKEILIMVSGKAKTTYGTQNGVQTLHSFLYPHTIIGDVELMQKVPVINDVIALEDVDVLALSIRYRAHILKDVKLLNTLLYGVSSKLIRSNHNKSISLTYPVENRLAAYILANAQHNIFHGNQQDASEMIGCSYRQLQRTLHQFIQNGILKKEKKGFYIIVNEHYLHEVGGDVYVI